VICAVSVAASCSDGSNGNNIVAPNVEDPVFTGTFIEFDRTALNNLPLPPSPDGQGFLVLETAEGALILDPEDRTPASAAAECAQLIMNCFHPESRNFAGCFENVPVCQSDTPWMDDGPSCCAVACSTSYQERLREGMDPPSAAAAAIWESPACMPGIEPA